MTGAGAGPRLFERDRELAILEEGLRQVRGGQGVGFAVTGESGAGKSSTIAAAVRDLPGLRLLRGQCEPLRTPRPLGPFRELGLSEPRLGPEAPRLAEFAARVLGQLVTEPTVLVVEDLHWVDEASAEVLRYLVRRVETVPVAILLSYRDLEVGPHHPARPLLGDFAVLDGLSTLALGPLSLEAVSEAVDGTGLDPVRVHGLTAGNPFYVAQVAKEPDRPLPTSVRDAVLGRIAEVQPDDLELLQLIASAPDRLDDRVLPLVGMDLPTLRRLNDTTLLGRTDRGIVFRHELARQAVESTIPPGGAPRLHQRLLDALERLEPRDPAVLTHHAVAARDAEAAVTHARAAAAEAQTTASNTEAAAFLEVALTHLPTAAPAPDRAGLLIQLCLQQYFTGRLGPAIVSARASIPLWQQAGDLAGEAQAYALMAVCEYQSGRRRPCDEHVARACVTAEASGVPATIARAHTDAAMLAWVGSDLARVAASARRTLEVATAAGLDEFEVAGRMMSEAAGCATGEPGARGRVLEWAERARERGWDELAWRGYVLVVAADLQHQNLRGAQRVVDETLAFVSERDLPVAWNWHVAFRGMLHLFAGRWSAAVEDSKASLADSQLGNIWPLLVLGQVALRRGGAAADGYLEDAWELARGLDEPLRYLPALSALAERMWMTGRADPRVTEHAGQHLAALGASPDTPWAVGDLLVWLRRLAVPVTAPPDVPEPYRSMLEGRSADAASWWQRAGNPFAEAMAWADSANPVDRVRAVALLDQMGAIGAADRLRVELRRAGLDAVPQRPRESTRANPGGLTNRQLDVARLVARGLSNNEIASRLYISPKTADHHVSAILAKLELPNRRAVVVQADELGLA